jgi:thioester reductase-like protein
MHRIVAIPADLGRERFGLEPSAFRTLASRIRAAYHCAAEVNFIAPYEKLATTNVRGLREMIRLVSMNGAILHHVSSVAVFPYGGNRIRYEDEDITQIAVLAGGYAQSKWSAERMIWKAISQGLRAAIYRPAQIIDRKRAGPPQDLFEHVVRACITLGAIPDIETKIDMITADYAAAAIRCLSDQESSLGKAFHLVHPQPVALRDFVGLFPKPPPLVSLESWLELLRKESARVDDPSMNFVSLLSHGLGRSDLTPPIFDSTNTIAGLLGKKVICPALDDQFIKMNIAQAWKR